MSRKISNISMTLEGNIISIKVIKVEAITPLIV